MTAARHSSIGQREAHRAFLRAEGVLPPLARRSASRTSAEINAANVDAFREGLRERGYVEGETFVIEYRSADGRDERFPALAAELVRLKVDVIVTRGTPAALAAKRATSTIPVIMTGVGAPVGQGVVASLARPGANITGLSAAVTDIYPKRVQLLKEIVPKAGSASSST